VYLFFSIVTAICAPIACVVNIMKGYGINEPKYVQNVSREEALQKAQARKTHKVVALMSFILACYSIFKLIIIYSHNGY